MEQLTPDDRICAQEKALEAVNCELALLRQHMDAQFTHMREMSEAQFVSMREMSEAQFASMREMSEAQFAGMRMMSEMQTASMRQYTDDGLIRLRLEMQLHTNEAVATAVAQLGAKIDRNSHWTIGLLISIVTGIIALAARGQLG